MLICLLFCVSDETVRYAATLCLAKTHSRDKELKNHCDRSGKARILKDFCYCSCQHANCTINRRKRQLICWLNNNMLKVRFTLKSFKVIQKNSSIQDTAHWGVALQSEKSDLRFIFRCPQQLNKLRVWYQDFARQELPPAGSKNS